MSTSPRVLILIGNDTNLCLRRKEVKTTSVESVEYRKTNERPDTMSNEVGDRGKGINMGVQSFRVRR